MSSLLNKHGVFEIKMKGSVVPFGYEELIDKPGYVTPVTEELEALEKAVEMIEDGSLSYAAASEWLEYTTNRKISRQGLHSMMKKKKQEKDNAGKN